MNPIRRLKSEWAYARGILSVLRRISPLARDATLTIRDEVEEWAAEWKDHPALISDRERLSYRELFEHSNRWARWAIIHGVEKGDRVALLMPNRPEYMAAWIGISMVGGVTALVNTHLGGEILAHSLAVASPRHVVVDAGLLPLFETAAPLLRNPSAVWVYGEHPMAYLRVDEALAELSPVRLSGRDRRALAQTDDCLWIYTSGTTGMPKAARLNHYRVLAIMNGFSAATRATSQDRIYVAQPMYHSAGGVLAPGIVLTVGGSCVVREKFSATEFWSDVVRHDCTMIQYIGELCRWLLATPPCEAEHRHRVRIADGNGLRPDIWEAFRHRFRIPQILEWFAATEGNVVLLNFDGRPGAVGRIPWYLAGRMPTRIVRFDLERSEPLRDDSGRCILAAADEVGEAIGEIVVDADKPAQRFDGYADAHATQKKILRDVFRPGDTWFRTGDLMRRDRDGYFYFVDRIGDTFRWKGENVATSEVSEAISPYPGIEVANVYGVTVPGHDGRAGMVALTVDEDFDLVDFAAHVVDTLPPHARPLFLRLRDDVAMTGTFKLKKSDLVAEGCDPSNTRDPLFLLDVPGRRWMLLDDALWQRLTRGEIRL